MSALDDLIARDTGPVTGKSALDALIASDISPIKSPINASSESTGILGQLKHQLGLTVRAGATALTVLPNMLGDALNGAINLGVGSVNRLAGTSIPSLKYPSQITQEVLDSAGVSQPQNAQERMVQTAASAMGGTGPSMMLGKLLAKVAAPVAQAVGSALQAAPTMQAISSAGSGLGGQGAAELGYGPAGQVLGAILGGGTSALASKGGKAMTGESAAQSQAQRYASALRDRVQNELPSSPIDKPRLKLNVDGSTTSVNDSLPTTKSNFNTPAPVPEGGMRPVQSQLDTIALLKKIGLEDQRPATISGDKFASGIDYENAKLANLLGEATRTQLAKEQTALKDYATGILHQTGGKSASPEAMGQAIRAPMQDLSMHFDAAIGKIYDAARTTAGDMGSVNPKNLNSLIGDHGFRETLLSSTDGTALLGSIERQVKRFQGVPTPGEALMPAPNTVNSAENLRKWLNSQWSPGNSNLIGQVKQALDTDVAMAGGAGVFDQARKLHGLRRDTLDNPNGISKLLASDGPRGINQAIPDELVGSKLLTMPTGQFGHIVNTLKTLPDNLQPAGQQALAEIKAELIRKIYKAGDYGGTQNGPSVWNAANVTRELNANKSKMALVFSPDELDKIKTLHDAGHIIQTPMAYKGATAQGYNYIQKGVLAGLPAGGAGIGSMFGGAMGAVLGSSVGGLASGIVKPRIDAAMAAKLAAQLRSPKPTFPPQ